MHYVFNPDHYIGIVIANTTLLYKYNIFFRKFNFVVVFVLFVSNSILRDCTLSLFDFNYTGTFSTILSNKFVSMRSGYRFICYQGNNNTTWTIVISYLKKKRKKKDVSLTYICLREIQKQCFQRKV